MMPFRLGLTGSIGMGKSTTAQFFRDAGVPVWDADETVARLYAPGGAGARAIASLRPEAVPHGGVDRAALKRWIAADAEALSRIEAAIHPLVAADRATFLERAEARGEPLVVLDIPLLYETGAEAGMDAVLVVTAPPDVQRARVLGRPGMTAEMFEALLAKQLPDAEKRRRADYVIEADGLEAARGRVLALVHSLRRGPHA